MRSAAGRRRPELIGSLALDSDPLTSFLSGVRTTRVSPLIAHARCCVLSHTLGLMAYACTYVVILAVPCRALLTG